VQENREDPIRSTSPGLAHALHAAYHLIQGQTVLFGMADTIMEPKAVFREILQAAQPDDDVLLGLYRTQRPQKFGMVQFDELRQVQRIVDKPAQTDLEYMWGCIVWGPRFTEHLHDSLSEGLFDFAYIMNTAIAAGQVFRAVCLEGSYADLGTYEEVSTLEQQYRAL
jgi:glucose-1-phosphate thymidylyltransferase